VVATTLKVMEIYNEVADKMALFSQMTACTSYTSSSYLFHLE